MSIKLREHKFQHVKKKKLNSVTKPVIIAAAVLYFGTPSPYFYQFITNHI